MSRRQFILVLLALLVPMVAFAEDKNDQKDQKPSEDVVKEQMKKQYGTSDVGVDKKPYYTITLDYKEIKYGEPHEGDHWHDGTPANLKRTVYPVKVDFIMNRTTNYDGSKKVQHITGKYGFFRDEFGDWTFRIYEEKREDVK